MIFINIKHNKKNLKINAMQKLLKNFKILSVLILLPFFTNCSLNDSNTLSTENINSAQSRAVNNYNFTLFNQPYTPLVGGTIFQSGTQLNTDAASSAITLPFPFTIYGNTETKIFIQNNGYITFGPITQTSTSIYSPISTTVGTAGKYKSLVSGMGNQIIASTSGNPEIKYGINSTGDFVVQYQDVSLATSSLTRFTFQIILKANGSTIQIMYGPNCTGQYINARASQVGLRGPQTPRTMIQNGVLVEYATPITEVYNNLSLGNGNWNKFEPNPNYSGGVTIGQANYSAMTTRLAAGLIMVMPNSGLVYQWSL